MAECSRRWGWDGVYICICTVNLRLVNRVTPEEIPSFSGKRRHGHWSSCWMSTGEKTAYFRRLWDKEPGHSETIYSDGKGHLYFRSLHHLFSIA